MKKLFVLFAISAFALSFSACKKDYTCECVTSYNGEETGSVSTTITDTKSKAEETCDEGDTEIMGSKVECEIK